MTKHKFHKSLWFAIRGITHVLSNERNIKAQAIIGALAIFISIFLGISKTNLMIIIIVAFLILILELLNTAMERFIDKVHPDFDEDYGHIKDILAGAVLLSVMLAIIIGVLILLEPIRSFVMGLLY